MTSVECLAKAEEAEAMARVVSLGTDKARFLRSAEEWRAKAAEAAKREAAPEPEPPGKGRSFRKKPL